MFRRFVNVQTRWKLCERKRRGVRDLRVFACRRMSCYIYARRSYCSALWGLIMAAVRYESIAGIVIAGYLSLCHAGFLSRLVIWMLYTLQNWKSWWQRLQYTSCMLLVSSIVHRWWFTGCRVIPRMTLKPLSQMQVSDYNTIKWEAKFHGIASQVVRFWWCWEKRRPNIHKPRPQKFPTLVQK